LAFPVVEATNANFTGATTSHAVALPSGITAGHTLLIISSYISTAGLTPSEGFGVVGTNGGITAVYAKVSDGSEGADTTFTTGGSTDGYHITCRISGASGNVFRAAETTGTDPPNLAPGVGAKDFLWFTALLAAVGESLTAVPTNYGNLLQTPGGSEIWAAVRRELNAASENPGNWTAGGSVLRTLTVAVEPAAAAAGRISKLAGYGGLAGRQGGLAG
jgi:hypothetical protein